MSRLRLRVQREAASGFGGEVFFLGGEAGRWREWLYQLARSKMLFLILGGAVGTCARYGISRWFSLQPWGQDFPWGTLVINVSGSFILGFVAVLVLERLPPEYQNWYLLLGTGFCGGYTTFSTFELETLNLVRDGSWELALANVFGSVIAGFVGVYLGVILARLLLGGGP